MKPIRFSVLVAAATVFLAVPVFGQSQGDISGRWQLTLPPPPMPREQQGPRDRREPPRPRARPEGERPPGPPPVILVLEQNGATLTGTTEAERGTVQIECGTVKGDTVTLTLTIVGPEGREQVLKLQGHIDGDTMEGTVTGGPAGEAGGRVGEGDGPKWHAQRVNG